MVLKRCETLWGEANLMYGDPPLRVIENAIYLPYEYKASWGIFDESGCIVQESVDYRGPQRETPLQDLSYKCDFKDIEFAQAEAKSIAMSDVDLVLQIIGRIFSLNHPSV